MITKKNSKFEPLLNAKLLRIHFAENEFKLEFDNGRTFVGQLRLSIDNTKLEPRLKITCGYHIQPFKKGVENA